MDLGIAFYLIRDSSIYERTAKLFGCGDGVWIGLLSLWFLTSPHLLSRTSKHFTIQVGSRQQTVSIDRLKPAFQLAEIQLFRVIPSQALVLYTDGSKSDSGRAGSGVYAKAEDGLVFRCRFRNPDNCSVFRSELLANREASNCAQHLKIATSIF
ncbi:hypothetical protein AVEN_159293-1 [Araneus ventricosus]|uniref:RNase H type-1 domain-containing protein n=1 Tax=Araneus ventricosus TaxID=182803 RepID=A0A4Y2A0G9_ARAVE|nr:hypothetical protein AVEN_159293-1 [Araneus ventricosus]